MTERVCQWCFVPISRRQYEPADNFKDRQFCNQTCASRHTAEHKKNIRKTKRTSPWFYPPPGVGNEKGYY